MKTLFILLATGTQAFSLNDLIGIAAFLVSVGGIVFSAGVQRAQISHNTNAVAEIKKREEAAQKEKLAQAVADEKRLGVIEGKLDTLIALMAELLPNLNIEKLPIQKN